jgi:Holliday junction DNA helicase RuvA
VLVIIDLMISYLKGKVLQKDLQTIILDVNNIGYEVFATGELIQNTKEGEEVEIWTFHSVKENAEELYGFKNKEELDFFKLLLTVSGIGPKSALSILNSASIKTLREGIQSADSNYLSKISGIGKKVAEKIVVGLKDKLGVIEIDSGSPQNQNAVVIDALTALGYSERESRNVVQKIKSGNDPEKMIKEALKIMNEK